MSKLMIKLGVMVMGLAVASFNASADSKGEGVTPVTFDAFEAGGAVGSTIWTHIAGQQFKLDVVAVKAGGAVDKTYDKKVTVGLVDASAAGFNCATANPIAATISPLATNDGNHGNERDEGNHGNERDEGNLGNPMTNGKVSYTFIVPNAYRNLQVRVTERGGNGEKGGNGGVTSCSNDHFSVRPLSFAVSSNANADATGTSATATPTVTVGANFALSASAVFAAKKDVLNTVTNYNGTPKIDPAKLARANAAAGVLTGGFAAAAGGVASGTFTYSEVGYFRILAQGVYDDSFTAVDQTVDPATSDCVVGSASNTPDAKGRVGCNIGNATDTDYFGRFVLDANAYKGSDTYIYRGRRGR